ncbi:MAG: DUF975 family protein [Defluviitaleaceae bacterium]|nr:DUF975 family protein [Defluviitaleaceae bacterium]
MFRSRQEIKAHAKSAMKAQWGTSIAVILVFVLVVMAGVLVAFPFLMRAPFVYMLIIWATIFFVDNPLVVNLEGVFIKIFNGERASVGELFSNLPVNYLRKVGGMAWMGLFTMLWTLLFFIPGIVKGIAYSMTPFILADCPNVTAKEALKLSMRMTKGHKMELFVMYLSFIGWSMLGGLTFGILNIVFVNPYLYTTCAGYYVELKQRAIASGEINAQELM